MGFPPPPPPSWAHLIQILEINQIVGFVVNYLHPVLLVYLDGFLPSKGLIECCLESLFEKKGIIVLSVWATTDNTKWEPLSWPIKHTYFLILAINVNFPLRLL